MIFLVLGDAFITKLAPHRSFSNSKHLKSSISTEILVEENKLASLNNLIKEKSDQINTLNKQADKIWKVDLDSSEIESGSSGDSELSSKRAKLIEELKTTESEAAALATEIQSMKQKLAAKPVEIKSIVSEPVASKPVDVPVTTNDSTNNSLLKSLSTSTSSGFDLGLLIAFPLMVGSLLFFLFFPVIGESLSANSGP